MPLSESEGAASRLLPQRMMPQTIVETHFTDTQNTHKWVATQQLVSFADIKRFTFFYNLIAPRTGDLSAQAQACAVMQTKLSLESSAIARMRKQYVSKRHVNATFHIVHALNCIPVVLHAGCYMVREWFCLFFSVHRIKKVIYRSPNSTETRAFGTFWLHLTSILSAMGMFSMVDVAQTLTSV